MSLSVCARSPVLFLGSFTKKRDKKTTLYSTKDNKLGEILSFRYAQEFVDQQLQLQKSQGLVKE